MRVWGKEVRLSVVGEVGGGISGEAAGVGSNDTAGAAGVVLGKSVAPTAETAGGKDGAVAICAICGPESKLRTVVGFVLVESRLLCLSAFSPSPSGSDEVNDASGPVEEGVE